MNEERKEQNIILKEALREAKRASRAKTEFLARMSHDMRTPMNGILGTGYLMEDAQSLEDIKKEIPKIRQSGEYLLQLINDVLDVNKVESGDIELHPKVCNEEEVFSSIIDIVKQEMDKKSIQFNFKKININWSWMMLDVQRVKQIFINLFTNAIKFTPSGGTIDFVMELVSEDETMIRDKFIIRDSGIGMSKEFIPIMFQPFAQENRIHENLGGTGLGLSIVKNLVELMGGTISVESEVGKGTEITLYLNFPLAKEQENLAEKNTIQQNEPLPEGLNILLCEDHPINAEITRRLLQKKKANVIWAENGQLGLEKFEQSEIGYFDVILMDIRMPILDGVETTKEIRKLTREDAKSIPIIAMTANAYEEDVEKSLKAGMNAHLAKPVEPIKMYETISKFLG